MHLQLIQEKVLSTIQGATAHATHVDAQDSSGSGVLLQVVGTIKYRDVSSIHPRADAMIAPAEP